MGAVAHVLAADPVPARSQMGSSLGFHIILACFGIAFAAVTMTAEWIGIARRCRGAAAGAPLVEGHGGAGGGRRGVGDRAVV